MLLNKRPAWIVDSYSIVLFALYHTLQISWPLNSYSLLIAIFHLKKKNVTLYASPFSLPYFVLDPTTWFSYFSSHPSAGRGRKIDTYVRFWICSRADAQETLMSMQFSPLPFSASEIEQDPVGLLGQKPFCVPCSLFVGHRLQPPWTSLSSKGQIRTVANQGREGMQRQGGAAKKQ